MGTTTKTPASYSIGLYVSQNSAAYTETTGYEKVEFPGVNRELARVELRGEDLEALLSDTKQHIDLIRVP